MMMLTQFNFLPVSSSFELSEPFGRTPKAFPVVLLLCAESSGQILSRGLITVETVLSALTKVVNVPQGYYLIVLTLKFLIKTVQIEVVVLAVVFVTDV